MKHNYSEDENFIKKDELFSPEGETQSMKILRHLPVAEKPAKRQVINIFNAFHLKMVYCETKTFRSVTQRRPMSALTNLRHLTQSGQQAAVLQSTYNRKVNI